MPDDHAKPANDAVVVTGGTTGIGLAITLRFLAQGKQVYTLSRRGEDHTDDLDKLVKERGLARPRVLKADVADRDRLVEIAGELEQAGVRLRAVVGSAGINVREVALSVSDAAVRSMLDINLYGLMSTFQVFGPLALKQSGARFIAISSLNAIHGMKLRAPYSATKAGVTGFVRALAVEWGPLGATVNAIAPGIIETPLTRGYMSQFPERRDAGIAHTPVGRLGSPEDIAHATMFLASEEASFVNGHTLVVDGGLSVGSSWW
jgi:NAD(P)-dependent dehydrogenase (short-subunit alcohol dehydrogenase family)